MSLPVSCVAWAQPEDIPADAVGLRSPDEWCGFLSLATDILWAASGRRWRGGPRTAECVLRAAPPRSGEAGWPYSRSWGHCPCYAGLGTYGPRWADAPYRHHAPAAVRLPHGDVTAIVSVTIDDVAFTDYRLDGAYLTRTDGQGWPVCRDRTLVVYEYGRQPPAAAGLVCVEYAVELSKAALGDEKCRLPSRVTSMTRQGLTYEFGDPTVYLERGLTGLPSADAWITAVNPGGRKQRATVWSPDISVARRYP